MHTRDYVTKRRRRADYVAKQGRRASIKNGEGIREGGGREQEEMWDDKTVTRPPCFLFCGKKENKAAGRQSRHK